MHKDTAVNQLFVKLVYGIVLQAYVGNYYYVCNKNNLVEATRKQPLQVNHRLFLKVVLYSFSIVFICVAPFP